MLRYLFYLILNIPFDIIAYLVSPILPFFVDSEGNLPKYLKWFQTQDATVDPDVFDGTNYYPQYRTTDTDSKLKIILYKYIRRVFWLCRNTGYTFAYDILGCECNPENIVEYGNRLVERNATAPQGYWFGYDKTQSILTRPWCLYAVYQWGNSSFCLRIYLGWKMKSMDKEKVMLAMYISPIMGFVK